MNVCERRWGETNNELHTYHSAHYRHLSPRFTGGEVHLDALQGQSVVLIVAADTIAAEVVRCWCGGGG